MEQILIINLHGFNSAPGGKADFLRTKFRNVIAPQLPIDTAKAISTIDAIIDAHQSMSIHIVGTSLGGFYTLYLSLKRKATVFYHLINAPLTPHLDLAQYVGQTIINFKTGEQCSVSPAFIQSLEDMSNEIQQHFDANVLKKMFLYVGTLDDVVNGEQLLQFLSGFDNPPVIHREAQDHRFGNISCVADCINKEERIIK
jgi:predicted esterase YcpF (UPF0227 family)